MNVLCLNHWIDKNGNYARSATSKLLNEIEKHFNVTHVHYYYLNFKNENHIHKNTVFVPLKNHWFFKVWNILFMYYENLIQIKSQNFDLIWIGITPNYSSWLLFLYKIFLPKKIFFIQLYTPSVSQNRIRNIVLNYILKLNLRFYRYIGSGTDDNLKAFGLNNKNIIFTNPGYYDYGYRQKSFSNIHLVYLGTISGRRIHDTILGLKHFMDKTQSILLVKQIAVSYDIIGGGKLEEMLNLRDTILKCNLSEIVTYHGFLDVNEVDEVFKNVNIGVAYLPKTDYYINLPSTKIVEYFLSGMAVLSVDTNFAKEIVLPEVGVLCEDNPLSFAEAIEKILFSLDKFNSLEIRKIYEKYSMSYMIKNDYVPKLLSIVEDEKKKIQSKGNLRVH